MFYFLDATIFIASFVGPSFTKSLLQFCNSVYDFEGFTHVIS